MSFPNTWRSRDHYDPISKASPSLANDKRGPASPTGEDDIESAELINNKQKSKLAGYYNPSIPWLLCFLLTLLLLYTTRPSPHINILDIAPLGLNCGNTASEAEAKGCKFDIISSSWTPAPCFDHESVEEYRPWLHSSSRLNGSFPFFWNNSSSDPLDPHSGSFVRFKDEREMSFWPNENVMYTTIEEHWHHCVWISRRLHRALMGHGRINTRMGNINHTKHCTEEAFRALDSKAMQKYAGWIATTFRITYERC